MSESRGRIAMFQMAVLEALGLQFSCFLYLAASDENLRVTVALKS
jgi:hypothetical protein